MLSFQSGSEPDADSSSASNAYKLSGNVATNRTWRKPFPASFTLGRYNGCAYTHPSTGRMKRLPNCPAFTLAGVSRVSFGYSPVRALSLGYVKTVAWGAGG